ncbi:MAG TPA: DUF2802 domain-containing protein [Gammaproteobacteria bacterium]|nr:DUF2802 domain-containing protein [Gammaproteobacteria bacterium]
MITRFLTRFGIRAASGLAEIKAAWQRARCREQSLYEELQLTRQRVRQLEQELAALCSASTGVGDHVVRLEQQVLRIIERQDVLELRSGGERPYRQASQLVHNGADIEELVGTCGLTRGEAELLVMMQRGSA